MRLSGAFGDVWLEVGKRRPNTVWLVVFGVETAASRPRAPHARGRSHPDHQKCLRAPMTVSHTQRPHRHPGTLLIYEFFMTGPFTTADENGALWWHGAPVTRGG